MRQYFDCNVQVGRMGYKHPLQKWRTEDILQEMDRVGIAGALVYHGMAKSHAPIYGNTQLTDELRKSSRLYGCWVVLPDQLGDFPPSRELIDEMKKHNVVAAKIFQHTHAFNLDPDTVDGLFGALAEVRIPLILDATEAMYGGLPQAWDQLRGVLDRHPRLPMILHNLSWSQERRLFPLLDRYKNLYVELSTLQANSFVEYAYERYGADQLLFGSGMPFKSPGAARAFIDYAEIPEEAKQRIAGGNLARLLGVNPSDANVPAQDEFIIKAAAGLPLPVPVLDSHTHIIEDGQHTGSGMPMIHGHIDGMVRRYCKLGISKMSVAPWVGVNGGDTQSGNLIAEKAMLRYPDMVESYLRIDPNYGEDVAEEAYKWHVEKKFRGMKPYFYNERIPYTSPIYAPWWKLSNQLQLYALVDPALQSDEAYCEQIDTLATQYPNVSIFMDHGGRSFDIAVKYADVARRHKNVTIQLTYTTVTWGVIEYLAAEIGAEKVLFGTDSSMRDPRPQVGWLAYADLTEDEKRRMFGANFTDILRRTLI